MAEQTTGAATAVAEPVAPADLRVPMDPNGIVKDLPCGFVRGGKRYLPAEFVPMSGYVRRMMSKKDVRDDFTEVVEVVLRQCVRRVGPFAAAGDPKVVANLTQADRDFLLMEIRRASSGGDLNALVLCAACKKRIRVTFKIDELEVVRLRDGDFEIRDDRLCFRVRSVNPPIDALCRYPIGTDRGVLEGLERNPTEAQYLLYSACLVEWGGKAGPFGMDFFDALPTATLDEFTKQFAAKKPGPILDQKVPCGNKACGADIEFTFEGSDFFFPHPTRGRP